MADTKLTALAAGTPDPNDLIYFVDDPSGTPISKKATIGSLLPTAALKQVLISQGAGVPPILDGNPTVGSLDADNNIRSINGGVFAFGGPLVTLERTLATSGAGIFVGELKNLSDSTVTTPGTIIVGGGANHVLARWDGTNWRVAASEVVSGGGGSVAVGSTPITGGTADRALVHSVAGDVVAEIAFSGTGNIPRTASPTFTGTLTAQNIALGAANTFTIPTHFVFDGGVTAANQMRLANNAVSAGVSLDFGTANVLKVLAFNPATPGDIQARSLLSVPNTVANLPAGIAGMRAGVTDASQTLTAGIGTVVAGGGANKVPVYFDGSNWLIG